MNKGKTMCRKNMLYKTVVAMMALVVLVMMPLTVSAGNETTGTIGDNDGITWTYDPDTKTLTLTGEDSGLQGGSWSGSILNNISKDIEIIVLKDCKLLGDASYMFAYLNSLKSLSCENVDTSDVTNMEGMFTRCKVLSSLDINVFNTTKVQNMSQMFYGCYDLTSLDVSSFNTSNVADMSWMFAHCLSLNEVDVSKFNTVNVTDMNAMFKACEELKDLDVSGFNTSNVTDMSTMFSNCKSLNSLDVSGFNTANVTNMSAMFYGCGNLSSLDVSEFDTILVTSMGSMFQGCSSLSSLDVSGFNTSNVQNMTQMFCTCSNLSSLDLSNFDTSIVKDLSRMFAECRNLCKLDISGFSIGLLSEREREQIFSECEKLSIIYTPKSMAAGQTIDLPATFNDSNKNSTDVITSEFCNDILTREIITINPFSDIKESSWQYVSAKYAYDNGLMAGKGQDNEGNIIFDPNKSIPREEFVQVLYNASGKPAVSIENKFPDVKNAWYKNAVLWANANDIANGKGNGDFGVTESISRQDLALMLYKYAGLNGYDLTANTGEINKYADGQKVSNYAKTAMDWAITKGVMSGKGTKGGDISTFKLDPAGTATRAECAAMLKNFMEAYGE